MKVSIICNVYNHEKYLRKCLDGFVKQECDFEYEVLIHDDASTDNSACIIKEYEQKYPNIIKPIYQRENQYSKGVKISSTYQYPRAKGEYLAWCEGDDCWIDFLKLKKQVEFLDNNKEYSICAHRVCFNNLYTKCKVNIPSICEDKDYSVDQVIRSGAFVQLSSIMIRKSIHLGMPKCFTAKEFGDIQLYIYGAICGKFRVLKDVMSQYNHGTKNSWTERVAKNKENCIRHNERKIEMLQRVNEYYNFKYDDAFQHAISSSLFNIAYLKNDRREYKKAEYKMFLKARKRMDFVNGIPPFIQRLLRKLKYAIKRQK